MAHACALRKNHHDSYLLENLTSPMHSNFACLPKATLATLSYVDPPDLLEQEARVNNVKSVATAVATSSTAPSTIPLLRRAKGSDRTPPPVKGRGGEGRAGQDAQIGNSEGHFTHSSECC